MNTIQVGDRSFEILIENETINKKTRLLGIQLNVDYEGRCPIFIGVLNGSFLFMADLVKEMEIQCEVGFIRVSSYQGTGSTGTVKEILGLSDQLKGRDIILVEDIVDTGFTLKTILEKVYEQQPASVQVCTLLYKPDALIYPLEELKYIGFEIPNEFVVGYGLDYDGLGRNLTSIYKTIDNS
ncbi:hypoxanthine phosphoribosyltransferase [Pedobacter antarcticus]|uniref:Hypoxanthine phosphoribosyltransferase n=2 Tax=Pedobacter antarcticus TaxID=34086 RepID=A0A081PM97_9SPHI|nr:hypoxanthine phosphoribosyltransferase [Pedobacter antarcticus]KEQ31820.1 hypoxanthine phosphoribosyltransferase [Pedobacter antarcticus 4BY]SDM76278.1 hypoxanthine phosphoribosyltransferase [Pedobacter antarcticus]SFE71637.1 hypoxanthine phosphoribosyltransferase [Pedobacter antarcticus]